MRRKYCYRFPTSILYTNKQISNEATHAFYRNNLFVYVYCGQGQVRDLFADGWALIPTTARKIEHDAMKVEIFSRGEMLCDWNAPSFVITCDELPAFCKSLLVKDTHVPRTLASTRLRLIIRNDLGMDNVSANRNEATESQKTKEHYIVENNNSYQSIPARTKTNNTATASRVRKLFEPFRQLHSIRNPQIIGPISEEYKAEITAELRKPAPNKNPVFDNVLASFQEATNNLGFSNFSSLILELKDTLDELEDARKLDRRDRHDEIIEGPYAGFTIGDAYNSIEFALWTKIAWACVKTGDFTTVHGWRTWVVPHFIGRTEREWAEASRRCYKIGMVFYLQIRNGRSYFLRDAIGALKKGLQYEPDDCLLAQELEKCLTLAEEKLNRKLVFKTSSQEKA